MNNDINIYAENKPPETQIDLTNKPKNNSSQSHIQSFMLGIIKKNGEGVTIDYSHIRYMTHVKDYLLTLFAADMIITIEGERLNILNIQLARRNVNQITEGEASIEGFTINKITINLPNLQR